jgi:hypothetical protein
MLAYEGADTWELLKCHYHTLDDPVEMRSKEAVKRLRNLSNMTVLKLSEGLGLTELGFEVCDDIDSNERVAETIRQGPVRMIAYYE